MEAGDSVETVTLDVEQLKNFLKMAEEAHHQFEANMSARLNVFYHDEDWASWYAHWIIAYVRTTIQKFEPFLADYAHTYPEVK